VTCVLVLFMIEQYGISSTLFAESAGNPAF